MQQITISSPVGELVVSETENKIVSLNWGQRQQYLSNSQPTKTLLEAADQLKAYFAHKLKMFDLPLAPSGTPFQKMVSAQLLKIPFGETRTYGEISKCLQSGAQAIGNACRHNSIPIIIPCHRVVSYNGLGGYSGHGGQQTKILLLKMEGASFNTSRQNDLLQQGK